MIPTKDIVFIAAVFAIVNIVNSAVLVIFMRETLDSMIKENIDFYLQKKEEHIKRLTNVPETAYFN
jgi:hypothetical protein